MFLYTFLYSKHLWWSLSPPFSLSTTAVRFAMDAEAKLLQEDPWFWSVCPWAVRWLGSTFSRVSTHSKWGNVSLKCLWNIPGVFLGVPNFDFGWNCWTQPTKPRVFEWIFGSSDHPRQLEQYFQDEFATAKSLKSPLLCFDSIIHPRISHGTWK